MHMNPAGTGRWLKGVADRKLREFADQHTIRAVSALGVEASFKCLTPDEIGRLLTFGGEPLILDALRRLHPGDCFYDIGANIGLYAVLGAKLVGPEGRVVAFEPESGNFARLQANALLNDLSQVVACPLAVSDHIGRARLRLHSQMVGDGAHALMKASGGNGCGSTTVFCLPLDVVIEMFGTRFPNHVKIDVEGHEEQVLAGMTRVLASPTLRTVMLEAHYYEQLAEERAHYDDAEMAQKRERIVTTMQRNQFRLAEEQVVHEGDVRFAHLLFVRE
jgi:FkbM family methyltransferase